MPLGNVPLMRAACPGLERGKRLTIAGQQTHENAFPHLSGGPRPAACAGPSPRRATALIPQRRPGNRQRHHNRSPAAPSTGLGLLSRSVSCIHQSKEWAIGHRICLASTRSRWPVHVCDRILQPFPRWHRAHSPQASALRSGRRNGEIPAPLQSQNDKALPFFGQGAALCFRGARLDHKLLQGFQSEKGTRGTHLFAANLPCL